jgi:hypothetical protein
MPNTANSNQISATPAAGGVGNLTSAQALTALAVLASSIEPGFHNKNATGMFIGAGSLLTIPIAGFNTNQGNQLVTGADSNNIYLGLLPTMPMRGFGTSGTPVGSNSTSGGGAGALTAAQALAALSALLNSLQLPVLNGNATQLFVMASQLVIPQNTYNNALSRTITTDSTNVYIQLVPGDIANGYSG